MTVSLEMVLPGILGYWADTRLGTLPLLIFVGFAIGMTSAIWHLIRMTRPAETGDFQNSDSASSPSESHEESDRK